MFHARSAILVGPSSRKRAAIPSMIQGIVKDASGTTVPGASVTVTNFLNHTNFAMQSSAGVVFAGNTTRTDAGPYSEAFNSSAGRLGQTATNARQLQSSAQSNLLRLRVFRQYWQNERIYRSGIVAQFDVEQRSVRSRHIQAAVRESNRNGNGMDELRV